MTLMKNALLGATPALAVLALALAAPIQLAAAANQKPLVIAVGAGPQSMDPQSADVDSNLSVMDNIFDALVERNTDGKLVPGLATSWERVDANTWRFKLRQGVKFHNGDDFTWEDVKFTFERAKDPKISQFSNFAQLATAIKTVNNDPWTIDITTSQPVPYFVQTIPMLFIMDKKAVGGQSEGDVAQHPIGTGPYKFVEWVKSSYIKVTANSSYWGGAPKIQNVELRPIAEASTRIAAIASGDVDILQDVPVALIKAVERNPKIEMIARPARRSIFLSLANKPGTPMADLRVRRAIYMAINEPEIIEKVMFGHATPAAQVPDPATVGYSKEIKRLSYDPAKAKELLKEAGYASGFDLTLNGPNDRYVQDAQLEATVAAQLAKVGIRVKVVSEPKAVFFPKVDKHDLEFYLIGWFDGSYDFGRTYRQLFHTVDPKGGAGGTNGDSYSNPKLDETFADTDKIIDPAKRGEALQKLNEAAMDQVVVIPLHYQEDDYAIQKGRGVHFTPRADTWIVYKDISFGS